MHNISDKFEFRPDRTNDYGVSCSWAFKKIPIDLLWKNAVSMLARSFLIESSSKLLVTRTSIKARTSLISDRIRLLTFELLALEWWTFYFRTWISLRRVGQSWSNFIRSITGGVERLHNVLRQIGSKLWCLHASSFIFYRIIIKVAGNQDKHKSSDEFDFRPDQTTHFWVTCPWMMNILLSNLNISEASWSILIKFYM